MNALIPILVTKSGIVIDVNAEQLANALLPIVTSCEPGENVTVANEIQFWNAALPIVTSVEGSVTGFNAVQPLNAPLPILVTTLPNVTDVNWVGMPGTGLPEPTLVVEVVDSYELPMVFV